MCLREQVAAGSRNESDHVARMVYCHGQQTLKVSNHLQDTFVSGESTTNRIVNKWDGT